MEAQAKVNFNMQNLALKLPKAFNVPKTGEVIEGRIIKKTARNLYIDLGIWGVGIVYGIEFNNALSIIKGLKAGDSVFGKVVEIENENGLKELSLSGAQSQKSWDLIRELKRTNQAIAVKILNVNRGGLMIEISGIEGFLPVSQLKAEHYPRVEGGEKSKILEELTKFIGQDFKVKVLDFNIQESKLIVSEKAADEEHLKAAVGRHEVGDIITGMISGIVDWGAFIKWPVKTADEKIGNETLEGLIHISELDWQLVENPADFVKVGDEIKAQIIDIMNDRISLSLKRLKTDPWKTASAILEKGMIIDGAVKKFNPFGAFVEVACGETLQGLCHVSEFGSEDKMKRALEIGKKYQFKLLTFVPEEHRMSLGLFKEEMTVKEKIPVAEEKITEERKEIT